MKVTYYLEVLSSWCHWVEPTWAELKERYKGRAEFEWKISLMRPEDFPVSRSQCDWFYRRSGGTVMHSPYMLNSGWFEEGRGAFENPSLVAEAGRDFGFSDDTVRLALSTAALRGGRKIGDMAEAVAVVSKASGVPARKLRASAESKAVRARVDASTAEYHAHHLGQGRPAFILEDAIGDKAVFAGVVRIEPLAATIDAMLRDTAAYAAHAAHHGTLPKR
jgi:hypothetical protein